MNKDAPFCLASSVYVDFGVPVMAFG